MKTVFFGIGVAIIVAGLFLLSALLTMLLVNVVLHHYEVKTLDYGSSLAIVTLLGASGFGATQSKK